MTAVVPHQSYMTKHPSLFTLINHCVIAFSFALMFTIVVGLLSAIWLLVVLLFVGWVIWNNKPLSIAKWLKWCRQSDASFRLQFCWHFWCFNLNCYTIVGLISTVKLNLNCYILSNELLTTWCHHYSVIQRLFLIILYVSRTPSVVFGGVQQISTKHQT